MSVAGIVVTSIFGSILLILILSLFTAWIILRRSNSHKYLSKMVEEWKKNPDPNFLCQVDSEWFHTFEQISIQNTKNQKLNGYILTTDSDLYIIYAHGYGGNPNEKTKALKEIQNKFKCNILCVEQRGQLNSEMKYCTMGINEASDLSCWIKYVVSKNENAKIVLYGQSMGAATVMNSFNFSHPKNVIAVIEDCGYVDVIDQFAFTARGYGPKFLLKYISYLMGFVYLFHDVNCLSHPIIDGIKKINVPFLAIHGEEDEVVSYENLAKVSSLVNSNIYFQKESFPLAKHACSVVVDEERYLKIIFEFINKVNR